MWTIANEAWKMVGAESLSPYHVCRWITTFGRRAVTGWLCPSRPVFGKAFSNGKQRLIYESPSPWCPCIALKSLVYRKRHIVAQIWPWTFQTQDISPPNWSYINGISESHNILIEKFRRLVISMRTRESTNKESSQHTKRTESVADLQLFSSFIRTPKLSTISLVTFAWDTGIWNGILI